MKSTARFRIILGILFSLKIFFGASTSTFLQYDRFRQKNFLGNCFIFSEFDTSTFLSLETMTCSAGQASIDGFMSTLRASSNVGYADKT